MWGKEWLSSRRGTSAVLLVALCGGGGSCAFEPGPDPGELGAGAVERQLAPGEIHRHPLPLELGTYLRLRAEQGEVDLVLTAVAPGGEVLAASDVPGRAWMPEVLSLVTATAGLDHVEVRTADAEERTGGYRLEVEELRPARPGDATRVSAEAAIQSSRSLILAADEDSTQRARTSLEGALAAARDLSDPALEGRALHHLGEALAALGEHAESLAAYRLAVERRREAGDGAAAAATLNRIADDLLGHGEVDEARAAFEEALALARDAGDRVQEALARNGLGALEYGLGNVAQTVEHLDAALEIQRQTGDDARRATTLGNLGVVLRRSGRLDEAFAIYREALELARRMRDTTNELRLLNNLGVLYRVRGELQRALETYLEGIEVARASGDRPFEADLHSNLGRLFGMLGDQERALERHRRALELNRELERPSAVAGELLRIGWLREAAGEWREAQASFEQGLTIAVEVQDHRNQAYLHTALGRVQRELGQPHAALEHLERALELANASADQSVRMGTLEELGETHLRLDDPQRAAALAGESLELAVAVGEPYQEADARALLARCRRRAGDLASARREIEAALATIEGLRSDLASQEHRASFLSDRQNDYAFLIDLLMEQHTVEPGAGTDRVAFAVAERARARSFVELMSEALAGARGGLAPELAERERQAAQRLALAQRELIVALGRPAPDRARIEGLRADLGRWREELERIGWQVRRQHPRYAEMRYPGPVEVEAVQAMLGPDTALLEYALGERRSFLFLVTRHGFDALELPPAARIRSLARQAGAALRSPGRRQLGLFWRASASLYELLVAPALPTLEEKSHLIVAPADELYYLPFEALLTRPATAAAPPAYLGSRWSVSYIPSASALSALRTNADRPAAAAKSGLHLVAFGDPLLTAVPGAGVPAGAEPASELERWSWQNLPGTRREVEGIAGLFPAARTAVYVGAEATESRLKRERRLDRARYVHLASHAFIDARRPAYSSILLTPEDQGAEDGLLQVHEVFRLRLGARLVVLSACETGLGKAVHGEGLVGLSRAFVYAGAEAVAVSLWPVADESTAALMVGFYRRLREGLSPSAALRGAKLELIEGKRFSHPYFWAPFVLVGDA